MSKRKKRNNNSENSMNKLVANTENIAQNSMETNKNTAELVKRSKSKLPIIISILTLLVTISGVTVFEIINMVKEKSIIPKIYLSSEYTKIEAYAETDITATLNFDADSVSITAYLNSEKNGDTVEMQQVSDYEWRAKVYFQESGIYKIVSIATTPEGDVIEETLDIEVIPSNVTENQIWDTLL